MKSRIPIVFLLGFALSGCVMFHHEPIWNPAVAEADARRDFEANKVGFCHIGGFFPYAPRVSDDVANRYRRINVGPQGCSAPYADRAEENVAYARRYNQRMWGALFGNQQ